MPQANTLPFLAAMLAASAVAGVAWRAKSLTGSGAFAAAGVGTMALVAGIPWGALLIGWFVLTAAASRAGRAQKAARTAGIVAKPAARDAWQVLANGGVFALGAAVAVAAPAWAPTAALAAAGALTAAGADTLATEFGTWWGGTPWSLRNARRVPPGTSGAMSTVGTMAMIVGAVLLGAAAAALGLVPGSAVPVLALAGITGAFTDTVIGAAAQERRWCALCAMDTEQSVHACGKPTVRVGGWGRLDNDVVNLVGSLTGALMALMIEFAA